jgi:ABC-type tungstate transport system substrate-binding protein
VGSVGREPTVRIELTIQLLQSRALPLGYAGIIILYTLKNNPND